MKVILALHERASHPDLLSPAFRNDLAAAGASRVQVNLDDADVAAALRFGPAARIVAVVSLWAPEARHQALLDVVRRLDPSTHAWSVAERTPLPGPEVPDGVRTDALANVAFLRRPLAMTPDVWLADWLERHTPVAIDTQGTFGYVQNPVTLALTPLSPAVAGIVEELFPMAAISDHHAFYGSGGDEAEFQRRFTTLMASCARFGADTGLDLVPTSRYSWSL